MNFVYDIYFVKLVDIEIADCNDDWCGIEVISWA